VLVTSALIVGGVLDCPAALAAAPTATNPTAIQIQSIDWGDRAWGLNEMRIQVANTLATARHLYVHIGGRGFGMGETYLIPAAATKEIHHWYWLPPRHGALDVCLTFAEADSADAGENGTVLFTKTDRWEFAIPNTRCNDLTLTEKFPVFEKYYGKGIRVAPFAVFTSEHFALYCSPSTPAYGYADAILKRREAALDKFCTFAERTVVGKIPLFLFPDQASKRVCTGHIGDGLARDGEIYEVFNDKVKLDPYHELTHIIMADVGSPPALFREGLAVYMQEGERWHGQPVDVIAARLLQEHRLVPLARLFVRGEIGSQGDDGEVAYPEAASFVKFLVETHGRDKFLAAYRHLQAGDALTTARNLIALHTIYGQGADQLEATWRNRLSGSAVSQDSVERFSTGNEQAVINRFITSTDELPPQQFLNSLDHAFAVLKAKAFPKPESARLSEAAITAMCEQSAAQGGGTIDAVQLQDWVSEVNRTGSFDAVLKQLAASGNQRTDYPSIITAGLTAMLNACGWDAASILNQAQVKQLEQISESRVPSTAERGVLGLRLDRWPIVGVVPGLPGAAAGIHDDDEVIAINGKDITDVKNAFDALKMLEGPPGETVKITTRRGEKAQKFEVARTYIAAMITGERVAPNVFFIRIPTFEGSGIAARVKQLIEREVASRESVLILDLRDNGGGRPEEANAVADLFLDNKRLQSYEFRGGRRIEFQSHPGAFTVRVMLLTNRGTGSASEMLAMALRDNERGVIVGEATAGALFGKEIVKLTGGETILFRSEPTVLSPNGRDYSNGGIPPDVRVADRRGDGTDDILVRAIAASDLTGPVE
jgi:carboxyl-terminal processing protease